MKLPQFNALEAIGHYDYHPATLVHSSGLRPNASQRREHRRLGKSRGNNSIFHFGCTTQQRDLHCGACALHFMWLPARKSQRDVFRLGTATP